MKMIKLACALTLGAALSACATSDSVTRDAPFEAQSARTATGTQSQENVALSPDQATSVRRVTAPSDQAHTIVPEAILHQINVAQINVSVPTNLKVSEANRYYPGGDIVWREDPIGNRHAQVARIMHEALTVGTTTFEGPVPVILDVQMVRFHALSEKARYTVGGVHHIVFNMALRDAKTGALLSQPRRVETDLEAFGGQQAITAEARGQTQKVRISGHIAEVIRQQMTRPDGYKNAPLGFYQLVNRL